MCIELQFEVGLLVQNKRFAQRKARQLHLHSERSLRYLANSQELHGDVIGSSAVLCHFD